MDSNYILTPDGNFISEDELYHWGIKGMKWGIRRYQNPDGTLTAAGRKRYTNADGTLNEKGKKYYAQESARLAAERKALKARQKTDEQLSKLTAKHKANEELRDELDGKKKLAQEDSKAKTETTQEVIRKPNSEMDRLMTTPISDLSTKELTDINNRLTQEANYRMNMERRGYQFVDPNAAPKTDIDYKIEELKKQKELLGLQKDIRDLTPKKPESIVQKLLKTTMNDVLIPSLQKAGKDTLTKYLSEAGAAAVTKSLKDRADKEKAKVEQAAANQKAKADKKAAKEQAKEQAKTDAQVNNQESKAKEARAAQREAERQAKAARKEAERQAKEDRKKYTVEGVGESSKKNSSSSNSSTTSSKKTTIDADGYSYVYDGDSPVTSLTTTRNTSAGATYTQRYYNTPIANLSTPKVYGYLPDPKGRDR